MRDFPTIHPGEILVWTRSYFMLRMYLGTDQGRIFIFKS
jgi:hypothetical protein